MQYVISTIPINCWSDIEFSPPLPESFAVKHVNLGGKVHLHVFSPAPEWVGIGSMSGSAATALTESKSKQGGANIVMFTGSEGYVAKSKIEDYLEKYIKLLYKDILPETLPFNFTDMLWHDWTRDPFT